MYADQLLIVRPTFTGDAKGGYTVASTTVIYDGWATVEDSGRAFEVAFQLTSVLADRGGAVAALADPELIKDIKPQDLVTVTFEDGQSQTARVVRVVRRGGSVVLSYR